MTNTKNTTIISGKKTPFPALDTIETRSNRTTKISLNIVKWLGMPYLIKSPEKKVIKKMLKNKIFINIEKPSLFTVEIAPNPMRHKYNIG